MRPGVDADESAGQREGVDLGIRDREENKILPDIAGRSDQPVAELVQVIVDFRIIEVPAGAANLAHDGLAQLALLRGRHHGLRRVAHSGSFELDAAGGGGSANGTVRWDAALRGVVAGGEACGTAPYLLRSPESVGVCAAAAGISGGDVTGATASANATSTAVHARTRRRALDFPRRSAAKPRCDVRRN